RDCRRIDFVDFAAVIDVESFHALWCKLRQKPAQFFAKAQMWSNDCQGFRIETGHVHCIANGAFEQCSANGVRDLNSDALLCFRGGSAEMWGKNKIWRAAQRRISWKRFSFKDVQCRSGHMPILQGLQERVFVNQATACAIDNADAAFGSL